MAFFNLKDFERRRYNSAYLSKMYQTINKHYPYIVVSKDLLANRWLVKTKKEVLYFVSNQDLGNYLAPIYVDALNEEYRIYMQRRLRPNQFTIRA